ncbi:MAG: DUF2851 family protein [Cytophagaceae bacterium]|jgi:hypothetical protein|nr:DUF2851 family protein [Cytophagaceae bacterium]
MKEEVLWVLWKYLFFDTQSIFTTENEKISIQSTGHQHMNSGPDFTQASIWIGGILWKGDVEIHVKSSDWIAHGHDTDPAYESVILHVVYEHDRTIRRADGTALPVLELKHCIPNHFWTRYQSLVRNNTVIPCTEFISDVPTVYIQQMKDRALIERLQDKIKTFQVDFPNVPSSPDVALQLLAKSLGTPLNDELMIRLVHSISIPWLNRYSKDSLKIKALLFGNAGWLEKINPEDEESIRLQKEYIYLQELYSLQPVIEKHEWKFLRTRPQNFPTVKLSQLAAILSQTDWMERLFHKDCLEPQRFLNQLIVSDNPIVKNSSITNADKKIRFGKHSILLFMVNAWIPYWSVQADYSKDERLWNVLFSFLEKCSPENNKITRYWTEVGVPVESASDSQAVIQWYKSYCSIKKCLSCTVGIQLLNKASG